MERATESLTGAPIRHAGDCHCGRVRIEACAPPDLEVLDCNCSICRRSGFLHLIVTKEQFRLLAGQDELVAVLALSAAAVALGVVTRREVARGVAHSSKRPAAPGVAPGGTSDAAANRVSIAIADCANETDEADLDGLSGMLITALEQSHWLSVMTRSRMSDVLRLLGKEQVERVDEEIGREIARRAGVDALLLLSVRKFGDLYSLDLKGLDIRRDEYLFTAKQEAHGRESIPGILDALAVMVRADLRERAGDIRAASLPIAQIATPNLDAYRHLYQAERHIDRLQMAQARAELEQAVSLDSTFGLAHSRLAYVDWWNSDFEREKRHIRRALALIDRVLGLLPIFQFDK